MTGGLLVQNFLEKNVILTDLGVQIHISSQLRNWRLNFCHQGLHRPWPVFQAWRKIPCKNYWPSPSIGVLRDLKCQRNVDSPDFSPTFWLIVLDKQWPTFLGQDFNPSIFFLSVDYLFFWKWVILLASESCKSDKDKIYLPFLIIIKTISDLTCSKKCWTQ